MVELPLDLTFRSCAPSVSTGCCGVSPVGLLLKVIPSPVSCPIGLSRDGIMPSGRGDLCASDCSMSKSSEAGGCVDELCSDGL